MMMAQPRTSIYVVLAADVAPAQLSVGLAHQPDPEPVDGLGLH